MGSCLCPGRVLRAVKQEHLREIERMDRKIKTTEQDLKREIKINRHSATTKSLAASLVRTRRHKARILTLHLKLEEYEDVDHLSKSFARQQKAVKAVKRIMTASQKKVDGVDLQRDLAAVDKVVTKVATQGEDLFASSAHLDIDDSRAEDEGDDNAIEEVIREMAGEEKRRGGGGAPIQLLLDKESSMVEKIVQLPTSSRVVSNFQPSFQAPRSVADRAYASDTDEEEDDQDALFVK